MVHFKDNGRVGFNKIDNRPTVAVTRAKKVPIVVLPSSFDRDYEEPKGRKVLFIIEHLRQLTSNKRVYKTNSAS